MSTVSQTFATIVAMGPELDDANQGFSPEVNGSLLLTAFYILSAIAKLLAHLILYPGAWLLSKLLLLLDVVLFRPVVMVLRTLALPFIAVGQLIHAIASIPFRIFDKFEVCLLSFLHYISSVYVPRYISMSAVYITSSYHVTLLSNHIKSRYPEFHL
jgi:hypothetical protein